MVFISIKKQKDSGGSATVASDVIVYGQPPCIKSTVRACYKAWSPVWRTSAG